MDFMQIVKDRYATKKFDGKTIPQEKITELEEMIRLSASSFGLQTYRIKVVTDAETKEKLLPASWNQPQITTCSHLFVFCADTDLESRAKLLYEAMGSAGVPAQNVEGYAKLVDGFIAGLGAEQRLIWAQKQAYIAMGNALNGAKALGFDSCPMEGFDSAAYAKILELPANLVPTLVVPVGYADDTPKPKVRLNKSDIFF